MYQDFLPIIIFTVLAVVLIGLPLALQFILSPRKNKGGDKLLSYECGEIPEGSAWVKFNVRFYVIALIFIIFDVEVIFMFPWAVIFNGSDNQVFYFIEMFIFMAILLVGLAYVWIKGDLDWVKMKLKYARGRYKDLQIEKSDE